MNKKHNIMKKKIKKLRKKIKKFAYYYYNLNTSKITDEKYDFLVKKLKKLEKKYPKLKKKINLYKYLSKNFKIKKHSLPMLSIKNTYSINEVYKYIKKIKQKYKEKNFCCELKIDGIAVSLIYKNNYLIKALTRGNTIQGEDITKNIINILDIPIIIKYKKIFNYLEIRGEIYISKKNFQKINKLNLINNKKCFSNSRNLVSGTIRQLNTECVRTRNLSFFAYDIIYNKYNRLIKKTHLECLNKIKEIGFPIEENTKILNNIEDIKNFYKKIIKKRKKIKFEIDGIIIKINNRIIQNNFINTKYIKWAIAYKFPTQKKSTFLKEIKYKIGRTGIITPIGIIKTINIGGVNIKHVNLYNLKYIKKLSLSIEDKILIERAGDVIPKINKILKKSKNSKISIPVKCPSCGNKINFDHIPKCTSNLICLEQIKKNIINTVSKNGLNITYLGPKIIKKLFSQNYIKNITDLFFLKQKNIHKILGIKKKLSKKILLSIEKSKKIKLTNFIYSLSIPGIGINTAKKISKKYKTLNNFLDINLKNLKQFKILSHKKSNSILEYLNNKNNINLIKKLIKILNIN